MQWFDWLSVVLLSILWGTSFFFVEWAIESMDPWTLVFLRCAIAALLMAIVVRKQHPIHFIVKRWRPYAVVGFLGSALPFLCFAWGQKYIDSGMASMLNALTPVFVVLMAVITGKEKFNIYRFAGACVAFVGVFILIAPKVIGELAGMLAAIFAALCYAIATIYAWQRINRLPPAENVCGSLFYAALFVAPFALWQQPWLVSIETKAIIAVLCLAVANTFLAYLLYYFILKHAGGFYAVLAVLLMPIVAVLMGVFLLGERLYSGFFIGGALVITGVIFADAQLRQWIITHTIRLPPVSPQRKNER